MMRVAPEARLAQPLFGVHLWAEAIEAQRRPVQARLAVNDPIGQHLADRWRDGKAADAATTGDEESVDTGHLIDNVSPVGGHGRESATEFVDLRSLEQRKLVADFAGQL